MILSRPDLFACVRSGRLRSDPPIADEQVAQVSIDLRLGRKFSIFKDPPKFLPCVHVDHSLWSSADLWSHFEQDTYRLEPGQFVLAQTLEKICIPHDLVGLVEGRSSWARVGITIHVTASKIDPGFDAPITLEMVNFGKVAVELRAGRDRPAQLMLLQLSTPLEEADLYGAGKDDRFQGQTDPIPYKRS